MRRVAIAMIKIYQKTTSPISPPSCRYIPTCSAYAVDAIDRHGLARGALLAAWRLLRCNPFSRGGYDPVK